MKNLEDRGDTFSSPVDEFSRKTKAR
jgi:hypothetical protein